MDFNKFTVKMQEAVETANTFAGEQNHSPAQSERRYSKASYRQDRCFFVSL